MEFSREYLQRMIDGQVAKSTQLDYKAAGALGRSDEAKKEIIRDISSFANAAGGVVIYGIKEFDDPEKKHLPERFDPVNQEEYSREWLDQIASQIQPRIDRLEIHSIHVGPGASDYCYVLEIPQSATAHQAMDFRYYKRQNFVATVMEDYEIRDVMNRQKHPVLNAAVRFATDGLKTKLDIRLSNVGAIMAQHFGIILRLPVFAEGRHITPEDETAVLDEFEGMQCWRVRIPTPICPLFPDDDRTFSLTLHRGLVAGVPPPASPGLESIHLTLFADDMPKITLVKDVAEAFRNWT